MGEECTDCTGGAVCSGIGGNTAATWLSCCPRLLLLSLVLADPPVLLLLGRHHRCWTRRGRSGLGGRRSSLVSTPHTRNAVVPTAVTIAALVARV